jgi:uncharacterized flavoprotein (TIGR03862 family)
MSEALVIGSGPAGLMTAEVMARAGLSVCVVDHKPSVARKFLMAGKSGLNLTKDEKDAEFLAAYGDSAAWLAPMISEFGVAETMAWAEDLGQEIFTGSTGRVFPKAMKASPLLRGWLARLDELGVERRAGWRWTGWDQEQLGFQTPNGVQLVNPKVTVLALGGGSWGRLGSDGDWLSILAADGHAVRQFAPSNSGIRIGWSHHMARHFGAPLKNIRLTAGQAQTRGEAIITASGLEGGGVYQLTPSLRDGANLRIDLLPDQSEPAVRKALTRPRAKMSMGTYLRKTLKLDPAKIGLLNESLHPLPKNDALAGHIKSLSITYQGLMPLDQAISTVGGLTREAVNRDLMLTKRPGTFAAGEMLDWDAPTGGYLITACLSTGAWAGQAAMRYARR